MKSFLLDLNLRPTLFFALVMLVSFLLSSLARGEFSVDINHLNEVTHLEIPEVTAQDYQIQKRGNVIELSVSGLDPKSAENLQRYSDQFIKQITVTRNNSLSRDLIRITLNNASLEMFDYLTDAPSSLSIDLYHDDGKVADADAQKALDEAQKNKAAKNNQKRSIASDEFLKQIQGISLSSELDEIKKSNEGPSGKRKKKEVMRVMPVDRGLADLDVDKVNFRLNSIIESRGKIFIRFPSLLNEDEYLGQLLGRRIEYEFDVTQDPENKDFVKVRRLFAKNDFRSFLKAKKIFVRKYPSSKYLEMLHYMEAESYFTLYKNEGNDVFFDQSLKMYDAIMTRYPKSNLSERTLLLVSYLRMKKGRHMEAIRSLKAYTEKYPFSPLKSNTELIMAQALLRIQEYQESLEIYEKLLNSNSPDVREKAFFDVGDVFFEKKDYAKAIKYYQQAIDKYPELVKKYPNVSYNMAEAQFLTEKYKEALVSMKKFIDYFPQHEYAAYAWTRMGEILQVADVSEKTWRGYYNESYFRFQNTQGGMVARINLLAYQSGIYDDSKFPMILEEMRSYGPKLKLPHSDEFLAMKISDMYFDRGIYKKATDELTTYFKRVKIPIYEDKFLKRVGRGISFQVRDSYKQGDVHRAFSIFDNYDHLWLRKSQRNDFEYLKGYGFEQVRIYDEAIKHYELFIKAYNNTVAADEMLAFEQLPAIDEVYLRAANCNLQLNKNSAADGYLSKIKTEKLSENSKNEYHMVTAKVAASREDIGAAIVAAEQAKNYSVENAQWLANQYARDKQFEKGLALIDTYLEKNKVDQVSRFNLLKTKLAVLEETKNEAKYYDFLKRFYDEFKGKNYDFDREKYKLGVFLAGKDKMKDAQAVWAGINEKSYWKKLATESSNEKKWDDQYKRYIDRIPAMAPSTGNKQPQESR